MPFFLKIWICENCVRTAEEVTKRTRLEILPVQVLYDYASQTLREKHQAHFYEVSTVKSALRKSRDELEYVKSKLLSRVSNRNPRFMVYLDRAVEMGVFEGDNELLEDFLNGLATALVEGRRKRKLSDNEKGFYASVLSYGGERVHNLISRTLLGPDVSTSKKVRSAYYAYI